MDEKIRINKFLSDAGVCSRREADRMILEGRITVNGEEAVSGQKVSGKDEICIDQIPVEKNEKKVLLLFNKPRGIVCSTKKQRQETTVTEYLDYPLRIYPVGRLDKESQGLLLLTNEGDLVNKIMRAGNRHEKRQLSSRKAAVRLLGKPASLTSGSFRRRRECSGPSWPFRDRAGSPSGTLCTACAFSCGSRSRNDRCPWRGTP